MAQNTFDIAWQRNKDAQRYSKYLYPAMIGLIALAIGFWLGLNWFQDTEGYQMNVFTELLGIGITILVIDRLNAWRDERNLKRRLVREAGSRDNSTAVSAIDWIRHEGWLEGENGILKGESLEACNLSGAFLHGANLEDTDFGAKYYAQDLLNTQTGEIESRHQQDKIYQRSIFQDTNLCKVSAKNAYFDSARFVKSSIQDADMTNGMLRNAIFKDCDLQGTDFNNANLKFVSLDSSNILGTNFTGADLSYAQIADVNVNKIDTSRSPFSFGVKKLHKLIGKIPPITTILPDGTNWTHYTDMTRFTDPSHPDFWRSDDPKSPAYRGADK